MSLKPSHMKIERFEDLRCWQAARQLVKLVFIAASSGLLAKDQEMKYQIKKAALSSMNNIAEGFGRFGPKDSIKFYDISQASATEVKSMLYVLDDLGYLTSSAIEPMRLKADETRNLTLAFIKSIRSRLKQTTTQKKEQKQNRPDNTPSQTNLTTV